MIIEYLPRITLQYQVLHVINGVLLIEDRRRPCWQGGRYQILKQIDCLKLASLVVKTPKVSQLIKVLCNCARC